MEKIADLFYSSAKKNPLKTAIWCDGAALTYSELAELAARYSNFLLKNGVSYGDHIGIPMNNSVESAALIIAAADIGAALVPINPTLPISAIKAAFESGDVKHIIARRSFYEESEKYGELLKGGAKICLDGETGGTVSIRRASEESPERPETRVTGRERLILTMTSGSTGEPKPIELAQETKLLRAMAHIRLYGITENDSVLAATPLYHSLAERLVIMPLLIGASSVLLPRFTPQLWLKCVEQRRVTFTIAVSAQLSQIAQLLSSPFAPEVSSLRCVVSSSALLEAHVRNELIDKLRCDFHEMYGTSETSTATSINFREALCKKQSVGRALPEAEIRILGDDGKPLMRGSTGEIAVKTSLMCGGYYKMPKAMEAAMADGFFRTGDMGFLDEDGYLFFCGRKKEIIITGGINVYPQDVESCVRELPGVLECAAFSYPDERLGEVVALAVVAEEGVALKKRAIQVQCARNLADFQQPHKIFFLPELPKNSMGKLVKSRLLEAVRLFCEDAPEISEKEGGRL